MKYLIIILFLIYSYPQAIKVVGKDSKGNISELKVNSDKSIDVVIQDNKSEIIDLYMTRKLNGTTIKQKTLTNQRWVRVNSVTGASAGLAINFISDTVYTQAIIQSIVGDTIKFNAPLDYVYEVGDSVEYSAWNMNVNGSVTRIAFALCPPKGVKWHITRMIIGITDDATMDDAKFGGLTSLTNGVVFRKEDGDYKNIFIVTDNGGFAERSYDVVYTDKAPAGQNGLRVRRSFNGNDKNGVVIELDGADSDCLKMIIQDNLTALTKMAVVLQGHRVIE